MFKNSMLVLAVCSFLLLVPCVSMAQGDETKTGVVKSVDLQDKTVTLTIVEDGNSSDETFETAKRLDIFVDGEERNNLESVDSQRERNATLTLDEDGLITKIDISHFWKWYMVLGALVLAIILSYTAGNYIAKSIRMVDYGWKMGVIFSSVACAVIVIATGWPPRFGVDLRGGVTLIYEIAEPEDDGTGQQQQVDAEELAKWLMKRVDPTGTKEIVIRPFGKNRIEIIIPKVGQDEINRIKERLVRAGYMQFLIVANPNDPEHNAIIELAREQLKEADPKKVPTVVSDGNIPEAKWVVAQKENEDIAKNEKRNQPEFKSLYTNNIIRVANTTEEINVPASDIFNQQNQSTQYGAESRTTNFAEYLDEEYPRRDANGKVTGDIGGITEVEVLMMLDKVGPDDEYLQGEDLSSVRVSADEFGRPSINFDADGEGAGKFAELTGMHRPDPPRLSYQMGIVLDNELISAPTIQSTIAAHGRITGKFTYEEVNELVTLLRAGKMPATLKKLPLSEDSIDSHLGQEMRSRGQYAILGSFVLVMLFMWYYYRTSGFVACLALLTNLICIVGMIILLKAPFSLTGLAGLVLTVGMSVDANVLIFERIREELERGSALRMAIRNGFGRATTTIVDANLTTLITAIVLYAIGTEQIRGFAVTLILGILMCMYTSIFCSRVVFDIAERQRWITNLNMKRILGQTQFDFIGMRGIAATVSLVLILIGLFAVYQRGKGIYAIDLAGGTSVRMVVSNDVPAADRTPEKVRQRIEDTLKTWDDNKPLRYKGATVTYTVTPMSPQDAEPNTVFRVDFSIPTPEESDEPDAKSKVDVDPELVRNILKKAFSDEETGETLLAMNSFEYESLQEVVVESGDGSETPDADSNDDGENPSETDRSATSQDADSLLALADDDFSNLVALAGQDKTESEDDKKDSDEAENKESAGDKKADDKEPAGKKETSAEKEAETAPEAEPKVENESESPAKKRTVTKTTLTIGYDTDEESLVERILKVAKDKEIGSVVDNSDISLTNVTEEGSEQNEPKPQVWELELDATVADAGMILSEMHDQYKEEPHFRGESGVGSQIAGDTQLRALGALLASLLGIIGYIWVRFQRVVFGLAAVVALIHDVLIVLGAIAVSMWFAGIPTVDEFKISLPVVAAFLTIIGYSLNDTIVVFDRIREVRGKSPDLTGDMINRSIGQTLSRTVLTSLTTLLVVGILYGWGGDAIHGFAFALVVGVLAGTYSSIFVASPVLLWLIGSEKSKKESMA